MAKIVDHRFARCVRKLEPKRWEMVGGRGMQASLGEDVEESVGARRKRPQCLKCHDTVSCTVGTCLESHPAKAQSSRLASSRRPAAVNHLTSPKPMPRHRTSNQGWFRGEDVMILRQLAQSGGLLFDGCFRQEICLFSYNHNGVPTALSHDGLRRTRVAPHLAVIPHHYFVHLRPFRP